MNLKESLVGYRDRFLRSWEETKIDFISNNKGISLKIYDNPENTNSGRQVKICDGFNYGDELVIRKEDVVDEVMAVLDGVGKGIKVDMILRKNPDDASDLKVIALRK